VAIDYPELGDFCEVAARILGTTPEQIAGGQVTQDEIVAWLSERTGHR
jgi:hypothetical protein